MPGHILQLPSYAKINFYLLVINKRSDGFHDICTVFQRIGLHDTVRLRLRRDSRITCSSNDTRLPTDSANLAVRSALLLQQAYAVTQGVDIRIIKRIPVGGGLGGGSSNAAAVLTGLRKLWRLGLSRQQLLAYAAQLGSDVPFFAAQVPAALGEGRGEIITPLRRLKGLKLWLVIVVPPVSVSTKEVYRHWDSGTNLNLTNSKDNVRILCSALLCRKMVALPKTLFNSLEQVTFQRYPEVRAIKEQLADWGVNAAMMSGSGSAVFGIVPSRHAADSVRRTCRRRRPQWDVYVTYTC